MSHAIKPARPAETAERPAAGPTAGRAALSARIGIFPPSGLLEQGPEVARAFLGRVEQEGIDHICCGDHVSFAGLGFDGLVQATALVMLHPTLPVYSGVYLLPLRHPVLVARQLADIAGSPPGGSSSGPGSAARIAAKSPTAGSIRRPGAGEWMNAWPSCAGC